MYKILKAETLAAKIHLMVVHAPRVASHCQPGQFIIVKMDEKGERIPLTICDYDREEGTVTIVFQEVGASTIRMSELKAGDSFRDFVGPLGCPSEFVHEDIEELKKIEYKIINFKHKLINEFYSFNEETIFSLDYLEKLHIFLFSDLYDENNCKIRENVNIKTREKLNEKLGKSTKPANFSAKLKREYLTFKDLKAICDILNYDLILEKKK